MKCQQCGKDFEPAKLGPKKIYCSRTCVRMASYHRQRKDPEFLAKKREYDRARKRKKKEEAPKPAPVHHFTNSDSYFYSLVRPKQSYKKRKCLKCGTMFDTLASLRLCAQCTIINSRKVQREYYPV
jgi:hypothetical protein